MESLLLTLVVYNILLRYPFVSYPASDWGYFLLLAIFPTLLGHSLLNWAVKWVSVNVISMSILFEPIGASILAYFILGENTAHDAMDRRRHNFSRSLSVH